jgi:acetyl esterase/lipase
MWRGSLVVVLALVSSMRADDAPLPKVVPVTVERDIVFHEVADVQLKLDLAKPDGPGPFPAVVCIHGGAWQRGSRTHLSVANALFNGRSLIEQIAERGYVVVSVSYRLAPKFTFPAQIEDVKASVRWVRNNAAKYRIDPARVAGVGFSAGGHLVNLLGTTDPKDELEGPALKDAPSTRLKAVVSYFGPTDFLAHENQPREALEGMEKYFLKPFLGVTFTENPEAYKKASPITYVTADDPPFLFFHGTRDPLVPMDQSHRMAKKLQSVGVSAKVIEVPGGLHGWVGEQAKGTTKQLLDYLDAQLLSPKP